MSFEQRVASVHPALFTIVFIAGLLFFSVFTANIADPIAYRAIVAVIFFAFVALDLLWLWSIYALASSQVGGPAKWRVAFLLTPFLLAAGKLLLGDYATSSEGIPGMLLRFAGGFLLIGCAWKMAEALEIGRGGRSVSIGKIAGTAYFLGLSIVGAWTLRDKILTLVARSPSTVQEA